MMLLSHQFGDTRPFLNSARVSMTKQDDGSRIRNVVEPTVQMDTVVRNEPGLDDSTRRSARCRWRGGSRIDQPLLDRPQRRVATAGSASSCGQHPSQSDNNSFERQHAWVVRRISEMCQDRSSVLISMTPGENDELLLAELPIHDYDRPRLMCSPSTFEGHEPC